ncbi:MAG TPA: acyltransferase [Hyphomicrobiaceae bacterium]|nr:acyltransferase [Hyphomicrobiaceae bacterium]
MHGHTPKHHAYVDALRGWAIFAVLIVHTSQHVPGIEARAFWIAEEGARGVQLFFVASALTLMLSWRSRDDGALPFYIRRFFRIAPMFWLAIVGYYLLRGADRGFWAPGGLTWWHISLTAAFLHGWHPATITSVVPGGWSIAVEMTFYAIFPLLIVWCSTLQKACLAFVISLALLPLMNYLGFAFYDTFESPPPTISCGTSGSFGFGTSCPSSSSALRRIILFNWCEGKEARGHAFSAAPSRSSS